MKPQAGHELAAISRNNLNGAEGSRTPDLSIANAALSQLSYRPQSRVNEFYLVHSSAERLPPVLSPGTARLVECVWA